MQEAPSLWPALMAFAAVLALIPVALWLLKRLHGGVPGPNRVVTVMGGITLGPRERIAVIEAQGRRWLIGVTGQSISLLAELERTDPTDAARDPVPAPAPGLRAGSPFAQLLERIKRHG